MSLANRSGPRTPRRMEQAELFFRHAGVVVFERDARVHDALVQVVQLVEPGDDVVFNGLGEGDVVRGKNQFHDKKNAPLMPRKSSFSFAENPHSEIHAKFRLSFGWIELCLPCRWVLAYNFRNA